MDTILLVDDNPANLTILLKTLEGRGYKLLVAKNGKAAIRIAQDAAPCLILLDIIMPNMDGYEVCHNLKSNPATQDIAIIFLSALDDTHDKVKGLQMGAVDYIPKPFQPDEVIARVASQVKIQHLESALKKKNFDLQVKNERILQTIHEGIIEVDIQKNITFTNPAGAKITGYTIKKLLTLNIKKIIKSKDNTSTNTALDNTLTKGVAHQIEKGLFWHENSKQIPARFSITPIFNHLNKNIIGAIIVFSDISEKVRQQAELKAMRDEIQKQKDKLMHMSRLSSMGEMASGFAHEINQPLTSINNYSQAAIRIISNDKCDLNILSEVMSKIANQACRAGNIVSRIKNFVRKPKSVMEVANCNKVIKDIVILAEVDSKDNNVFIHLDLAEDIPELKVDVIQIQQVVLNLLRNAMEAMKNQPNQNIGIWIKTEKQDNDFVLISVVDRGHGLPENAAAKLFTPFYSTKSSGLGIGLSVCHSIIEAHKGVLGFQSNPEGGTIFTFTLPINT